MRFVIFSGTTEGRELSRLLAGEGARVTVCVATEYGSEEQGSCPGVQTLTGPLSQEEKARLLEGAALCVDATHPYARHVTQSVREVCEQCGTPYCRLLRQPCETGDAVVLDSAAEAADWLQVREGNILLTTGANELTAYAGLSPERLFPRVLPSHRSLSACEEMQIPHRNIIAMQGPFSRELNEALLRQFQIRWLVTKDGGAAGGFPEKAAAAKALGIGLIVLRRPSEEGDSFDTVLARCRSLLRSQAEN
ncbi:MAG: precorrin-6A reductase [Oscillospiraceae bacterium]|nr:precorrin-6A reductase [Oscillospiraceae bacterium]